MRHASCSVSFANVMVSTLFAASLAVAGQPAAPGTGKLTPEQSQLLTEAKTPEDLIEVAKQFHAQSELAAASVVIEKLCLAKPEFLTDSKTQTPPAWNNFWFAKRADMQARKLAKTDAAGRLKLAVWLREAGAHDDAAAMLLAALAIDKNNAEAKALADKWDVASGGPVRFDLRYGATQPLLLPEFQDEGLDLTRKDRAFLVLPFAYEPGDGKLLINKTMLKSQLDEPKTLAAVRGIALLEPADGASGTSRRRISLKLQDAQQPLYERLEIIRKPDRSGMEVTCHNTSHPVPPPRIPAPRTGGAQPPAPAGPPEFKPLGKDIKDGIGFAAFILEVPQSMRTIDCEYRGAAPIHLETGLLNAMSGPKESSPAEKDRIADALIPYAANKQGVVAAAAVYRLAGLRFSGAEPSVPGNPPSTTAVNQLNQKLDRALVTALAHPDRQARRAAFESIAFATIQVSDEVLKALRAAKEPTPLMTVLDETQVLFNSPSTEPGVPSPSPFEQGNEAAAQALAALPSSPAPANCFSLLSTCLASSLPDVHQKVIDLLLADGSQQSVRALAGVTGAARDALLVRFEKLIKPELKSALLRMLMLKADAATVPKLLAASKELPIVIATENDPLLTALRSSQSPAGYEQLLDLLGRADVTAVAASPGFKQTLDALAASAAQQSSPAVRKAMLRLATGQFKPAYEAPVKRAQSSPREESGFEAMLAGLAMAPDTAPQAAAALIQSGRIAGLNERLKKADAKVVLPLVQALAKDKTLAPEPFAVFLASRATDPNNDVARLALSTLSSMQKASDPKQRWRVNLAIKQGIEKQQLLDLTSNPDEKVSVNAVNVLSSLIGRKPAEAAEFAALPDRAARDARMQAIEGEHTGKPSGSFACMVYLDVRPASTSPQPGAEMEKPRNNIPLPAPTLLMQRPARGVAVLLQSTDITSTPPGGPQPGTIPINASPLLRAAIESPATEKEGLSDKLDILALSEARPCDLKYEQLGTWGCELTVQESGTQTEGKPLKIAGAKIVLEPIAP